MSFQKDYILRLMEEFLKALASILTMKNDQQYTKALDTIDETSQSLLHINLKDVAENETVFSQITTDKLTLDQIEILAELLRVKADIYLDTYQQFSAYNHYQKALCLFDFIQANSKIYSLSRIKKITEIKGKLLNMGS